MKRRNRLVIIGAVVVSCAVGFLLSTSMGQDRRRYEVEAQVYDIPLYQSDAARAVAACERLMERYADLAERSLASVAADTEAIAGRLDSLDAGLTSLDVRLARIEQHLGIRPANSAGPTRVDPNGTSAPACAPADIGSPPSPAVP